MNAPNPYHPQFITKTINVPTGQKSYLSYTHMLTEQYPRKAIS